MLRWFYNKKTSFKLLAAFVLIAIILLGVSVYAMTGLKTINKIVDGMYVKALQPMENMANAKNELLELRTSWRDIALAESEQEKEAKLKEVQTLREDIAKNIDTYSQSFIGEGEEAEKEGEAFHRRFNEQLSAYHQAYDNAVSSIRDDRRNFKQLDEELNGHHQKMVGEIDELWELDMSLSKDEYERSNNIYSVTSLIMIFIGLATLGVCIGLGILLARSISRPLGEVSELVEKVAGGDLTETSTIQTNDEVGMLAQSVNKMVLQMRETVRNILSAADNLSASSSQVSASTEEIASASSEQANAAQTMNELFRELSDAISSVATNTEQAAELSNETTRIAQAGGQVVMSSVEGAGLMSEQMSKLENDSNRIGEIISVIDDIADQTNLLALNAAIEAARAGDQGRGFAVVADEVRNLAERSGEATKQITSIIQGMQENTARSVEAMENGRINTQKSGEAFEEIIRMVNETGTKVTEIASASEEQAAQSAEVLTFIESISAATEEAAASSEETASTAHALSDLSEELNASVANFKL